MTHSQFTLELEAFRGPLELLLDLIERKKLHINDISLAQVADDYITFLQENTVPLTKTAQFGVIAATLLLIKSRSLLPSIELTTEEEQDIQDLEHRLALYSHIRTASRTFKKRWGNYSLTTGHTPVREITFTPGEQLTATRLTATLTELLEALPALPKKPTAHVAREISLDAVIESLTQRLQRASTESFKRITASAPKVEAIVNFLALLELVKRGTLRTQQRAHFDDITLEHDAIEETPHYG